MNKRTIRAFAMGIFFSSIFVGIIQLNQNNHNEEKMKINDAIKLVEEKNYIVLKKSEYKVLTQKETKQSISVSKEKKKTLTKQENKKSNKSSDATIINFQLEVVPGMTTNEIASLLKKNKIIEDDTNFSNYLIKKGYQTQIQLGSYSLTNRMSNEQIAKMITKQ